MRTKKIWDISSNENSLLDYVSFMCLRTNPKLSTNVKLVTNGNDIWLDSYSATSELAESRYKSQKVSGNGYYNNDLSRFYKGLDKSIPYSVWQEFDDTTVKTSYNEQYETGYWCGAEYINSLEFDEELGIVAPLWIDKKLPDYFVVFKIEEPSYTNIKKYGNDNPILDLSVRNDILKKCVIIKTFDLTENTRFGKYLRRYAKQETFPEDPLKVSLKNGEESVYSGISIENGCFIGAPEYNHAKYFEEDQTITTFDDYITRGFERNCLACANLLNIEFLFDDNTSEDYTMNRYFGLYCNYIEDGGIALDFANFSKVGRLGNEYSEHISTQTLFSKKPVLIKNEKGTSLQFLYDSNGQDDMFPYAELVRDLDSVFCIKDKYNNFHNITRTPKLGTDPLTITLCEKETDVMNFTGFVTNNEYINAEKIKGGVKSILTIDVKERIPIHTRFSFYMGSGDPTSDTLLGYVESEHGYHEENGVMIQDDTPCWYVANRFYGDGTPNQIAYALANSINISSPDYIESFSYKSKVVVMSREKNPIYNSIYVVMENMQPPYTVDPYIVDICGKEVNGYHYFKGGTSYSHLRISEKYIDHFKEGDYLKTNTKKGFGKITAITLDPTSLIRGNNLHTLTKNGELFYNITIDDDDVSISKNSQVLIYDEFTPTFGRLSFFPVKDFDVSTYENPSIYGDLGEIENEYKIIEKSSEDQEEEQQSTSTERDTDRITFTFPISGTNIETEIEFFDYLSVLYNNDAHVISLGNDLYEVSFSLDVTNNNFGNSSQVTGKNDFKFETLSSILFGNKMDLTNEYDMFLENYSKELMLVSKTVPYINKWVYHENCLDVREKPYRLNTSMAFGINSFSPNPYNIEPKADDFNQEWEYIFDEYPFDYETAQNSWSYTDMSTMSPYPSLPNGEDIESLLKSTGTNYFDILFVQDFVCNIPNNIVNEQILYDHLDYKRKYSIFEKGSTTTNSETFFRGVKLEILQKANYDEKVNNNLNNIAVDKNFDLNGYKFTVVMVPYTRDYENKEYDSRKIKVIRNDIFKFVVVLVYIAKRINDAISKIKQETINTPENPYYLSYKKTTRYLMYEPDRNTAIPEDNPSANTNIIAYSDLSVFGNGSIQEIIRQSEDPTKFNVYGKDTNFLTDFDHNANSTNNYYNNFVLLKDFGGWSNGLYENSDVRVVQFKVVEIKSDNHLVAIRDDSYDSELNGLPFTIIGINGNTPTGIISDGKYLILNKKSSALAFELKKCSFGNVFYNINHFQPQNVIYEQIDKNGTLYSSENGEYTYALKILQPELYAKYCFTKMSSDNQHIYYETYPNNAIQISRQSGYYTPLFRDVLYFKDPFVDELTKSPNSDKRKYLKTTRYCNTVFACDYNKFGIIKCLNFHRANDINNNVFDLTDSQKPLYPIQNKFSIGNREVKVFNSNWDPWYYTQTDSAIQETEIHGTAGMVENKAFLGSKYLKVPDKLVFDTFEYEFLNESKRQNAEILISETQTLATFDVDMEKRLLRHFKDVLTPLFETYVDVTYSYGDKTTIDDDIELYIRKNILPLYEIGEISIYEKSSPKNIKLPCDFTPIELSNEVKVKKGLTINTNASITQPSKNQFQKLIRKTLKSGYAYWFGLSVEINKK